VQTVKAAAVAVARDVRLGLDGDVLRLVLDGSESITTISTFGNSTSSFPPFSPSLRGGPRIKPNLDGEASWI
jgi:hypothetical protein